MNEPDQLYAYSVSIFHGMMIRSAAHTVLKPSRSAVCAAWVSPARVEAAPETGRKTP